MRTSKTKRCWPSPQRVASAGRVSTSDPKRGDSCYRKRSLFIPKGFSPEFSLHYRCDGKNSLHTKIPSLLSSLVSFRLCISLPCTTLDPGGKFTVTIKHNKNSTNHTSGKIFHHQKLIHKKVRNSSGQVCCLFWNYFNNPDFLHWPPNNTHTYTQTPLMLRTEANAALMLRKHLTSELHPQLSWDLTSSRQGFSV